MRILIVHNHYGSAAPSGENEAVALERRLLLSRGHDVRMFEAHSDSLRAQGWQGMVQGGLCVPWNPVAARRLSSELESFGPDVVHAHNTFPSLSPSVFRAARGAARVLTLHNYRLFCASAMPLRQGRVCTDCLDAQSSAPALRHRCYRGSLMATLPVAAGIALHRSRGTWHRDVEAFIALTDFQKARMIAAGLPGARVHVKANFYPGDPPSVPFRKRQARVVFAGRLSPEKGVSDLIEAWRLWGAEAPGLTILGDGPQRTELMAQAAGIPQIAFLGHQPPEVAQHEIARARLVVLPSLWFEGFPMVLREAFALGTPSIVSNLGPLPELVAGNAGRTFRAGDPTDLCRVMREAWSNPPALRKMSVAARRAFEIHCEEEANYRQLMSIYGEARSRLEPVAADLAHA